MFTEQEIKHAIKLAKSIAADKGEELQDWYYFASPNPQQFHVFRDVEHEYALQVGRVVPEIWVSRNVSDTKIEGHVVHYHKKPNNTKLITAFFLNPEKTYEVLQDGGRLDSIILSEL